MATSVTPTVYTTFYLGALTNADLIRKNVRRANLL